VVEWDPGDDPAWWRVYHRDYRNPSALFRRTFGPTSRFDHHRADGSGRPTEDPDQRSVVYLGRARTVATAEVFWDQEGDPADPNADPLVARVCPRHYIAQVRPRAPVKLLSLLDDDLDLIGALPELSSGSTATHPLAQEWARAIYEDHDDIAGLKYKGAHNYGECIVLWDRAPDLEVVTEVGADRDWSLHEDDVWARVSVEYARGRRSMTRIDPDRCPRCRDLGLR
jgi:hypothetical protein